jgi:hypothetical protein
MNDARFSACGLYRYELHRNWSMLSNPRRVLWVMLNPSTADANTNDNTISRCIEFSKTWGFEALSVGNAYAYRTPYPRALWDAAKNGIEIVGRENDAALTMMAATAELIVCGWGSQIDDARDGDVTALLYRSRKPVRCLVINADGTPKHPLYVRGDTQPIEFPRKVEASLCD